VIQTRANDGTFAEDLLGAFSSRLALQQELLDAMHAIEQYNPDLARTLVDTYFVDPALREQAEQALVISSTSPRDFGTVPIRSSLAR
jgi:hypothetical protein